MLALISDPKLGSIISIFIYAINLPTDNLRRGLVSICWQLIFKLIIATFNLRREMLCSTVIYCVTDTMEFVRFCCCCGGTRHLAFSIYQCFYLCICLSQIFLPDLFRSVNETSTEHWLVPGSCAADSKQLCMCTRNPFCHLQPVHI